VRLIFDASLYSAAPTLSRRGPSRSCRCFPPRRILPVSVGPDGSLIFVDIGFGSL